MKKIGTIFLSIAIILIISGLCLVMIKKQPANKNEENITEKESKKEIVDGDLTNIEASLSKQHNYKEYYFINNKIAHQGPYYMYISTIKNSTNEEQSQTNLVVTFYTNTKKEIDSIEFDVPLLSPNESTQIELMSTNEKIFEAYDFKISEKKS